MEFKHLPVLLNETIEMLNINPNGIYVDGTLGGAGHSFEICRRLQNGKLIGIDQDKEALMAARERLKDFEEKVIFVNNNFSNIDKILEELSIDEVDGILLDIGVSSYQLDEAERGFSFQHDAPLDMRMNKDSNFSAMNIINEYPEEKLTKIIFEYGEERWAKKIAKRIVEERKNSAIDTTFKLVQIIKKVLPPQNLRKGHPAKKTFQAIRIETNNELNVLKDAIEKGVKTLKIGGRFCIITFHSLEDRIVKNYFSEYNNPCICPPKFPICVCNKEKVLDIITKKPIIATKQELEGNSRASSAKLRTAQKI